MVQGFTICMILHKVLPHNKVIPHIKVMPHNKVKPSKVILKVRHSTRLTKRPYTVLWHRQDTRLCHRHGNVVPSPSYLYKALKSNNSRCGGITFGDDNTIPTRAQG